MHLDLQPDLANGLVPTILKNLAPGTQKLTASMVVATPKPMLVKLDITDDGEDAFLTGTAGHKARRYDVKIDIGGVKGARGKCDRQTAARYVRLDSWRRFSRICPLGRHPSFESGPVWRIELVSPTWPKAAPQTSLSKK